MSDENLKSEIEKAITEFCVTVVQNPMIYFSEADLQQLLVERLRGIEKLGSLFDTLVPCGMDSKSKYKTSLVHREYGIENEKRKRMDIVVFDENQVAQIDHSNLTVGSNYITPRFGFELGTEKSNETLKHFQGDIEKLAACNHGYLIHIYTDPTESPMGTPKHEKTEGRLDREFRAVFTKNDSIENITVIAILLRPYKRQVKTRGKFQLFDGDIWKNVNIGDENKIRSAIGGLFRD